MTHDHRRLDLAGFDTGSAPAFAPSALEQAPWQTCLTDDAGERPNLDLRMVRHRHGDRRPTKALLKDEVTAALPDYLEPVVLQDLAHLASGEDAQSTQPRPQPE